LTVADSGPGISAAQRQHLFQPFSAGLGAASLQRGSGLGLAICNEIVASLGGSITLDNRGGGATPSGLDASVRLPLADNHT
jgi:two-component system sensor histidine kinase TctE